jgi:two-component sensor histidine kinase
MKTSKHGAGREDGITRREIIGAAAGIGAASVFNPREAPAADLPGRGEFVIRSADVLTMDPALGDVDGDVHVSNGEIVAVGRDLGAASAEVIDARKMIALPGLIDTHNHIWNSTCRNVVMEGPERGYFRTVATLGKQYTPEDTYRGVRLGCAEMIYSGVTTVNDWSHNIRSPEHARADIRALKDTGIRARFSYGTYQGGPPQDQTMDLADLERSAWHHAASTRRFKQVAADRSDSDQRTFDFGDLTDQILMSLRPGLRKHNLTLNVACQNNLTMNSYPGSYGQVLTNLFLNSVTHAFPDGKGGAIDIKARAFGDDNIEVQFSDDGCGMSPTVRRQAFDPFFTTRRNLGSTGLGLHIVHNIVTNRLGGKISLDSEPGMGTKVQMILPRVAPAEPGAK